MDSPRIVPLFPLPEVYLFPHAVLPLHVFEPRYRQMIDHQLDRSGELVLGTVRRENSPHLAGNPPILEIATLGRMISYERLDDGRYLLNLLGVTRARAREVESRHLYRLVEITELKDLLPPAGIQQRLRVRLHDAIQLRSAVETAGIEELPIGVLADVLVQCLSLSEDAMAAYFPELDAGRRAELALALADHTSAPPP